MPYLTTLAIPGFFILSGYLFFTGFNVWDWSRYRTKIGSRLHAANSFLPMESHEIRISCSHRISSFGK